MLNKFQQPFLRLLADFPAKIYCISKLSVNFSIVLPGETKRPQMGMGFRSKPINRLKRPVFWPCNFI
ncbi:MAG: hypothetical protein A2915_00210 [Candidatus Yanofskybacteria bacterium RIFCSPLOWO2_01_FULL_41_34]|uniref:Uncharacterized protein n=1 Tax=Candidatus Yanofskybacteria bacterium RIFCSPHIGHO2_01_FULL_41_26 TaxID=1802661 RepID=A0A1F8EE85_9BACT|nr:MAG: hypothetical protein A2649_02140 [Candidatus Yanofskybacteria bacterium RIFCSPHIGHO2_01_FULL_41_26]OGN21245.1 MAG: hypothetical protein A2915_00210 [Candidatus Yanofskybacteria bacterium RIFCSPLOWO2_01_FULL_41_34]